MSKRTREEKTQSLEQLAKPGGIATGRKFSQSYGKIRLLIEHPPHLPRMEYSWPV